MLGAGAIGGFLGARLARAGADVVLIARGPHLEAMKESGLRVIDAEGDWTVPTGENEPPVLFVDRITVTAPRIRSTQSTDRYRPPSNGGEKAVNPHMLIPSQQAAIDKNGRFGLFSGARE